MAIKFASYNMYGFSNGYSMLCHLCQQCDVILIQEHWLQTSELQKLGSVDYNFAYLAVSSMDDKISRGIMYGRPFGGTGILWRKNLGINVKLIHKDERQDMRHGFEHFSIYTFAMFHTCIFTLHL